MQPAQAVSTFKLYIICVAVVGLSRANATSELGRWRHERARTREAAAELTAPAATRRQTPLSANVNEWEEEPQRGPVEVALQLPGEKWLAHALKSMKGSSAATGVWT